MTSAEAHVLKEETSAEAHAETHVVKEETSAANQSSVGSEGNLLSFVWSIASQSSVGYSGGLLSLLTVEFPVDARLSKLDVLQNRNPPKFVQIRSRQGNFEQNSCKPKSVPAKLVQIENWWAKEKCSPQIYKSLLLVTTSIAHRVF